MMNPGDLSRVLNPQVNVVKIPDLTAFQAQSIKEIIYIGVYNSESDDKRYVFLCEMEDGKYTNFHFNYAASRQFEETEESQAVRQQKVFDINLGR